MGGFYAPLYKLNINVIGGALKLLEYFSKKYKPKDVIIYVDRRYYTGETFKKIGFECIEKTKPNYWYVRASNRYDSNFLLKDGYDNSISEKERGYIKIYDCGRIKYKMKFQ